MEIRVEDITVGYDERLIIEDMNIEIPGGAVTALIGGNGCGKSTLLKTMSRILTPVKGRVVINHRAVHTMSGREAAATMAILPQQPTAPAGLTVEELVGYGRAPYGRGWFRRLSGKDKDAIEWAMAVTHLTELRRRPLAALSGGQRQRAWIAMAVAQDTELLFLDEPTSFLDIAHQLEVLELVRTLHDEHGKTIVMVLHDLNQAARYADYMVAMKAGRIAGAGVPEEVLTGAMLRDVFGIEADIGRDARTGRPLCNPLYVTGREEGR